MPREPMRGVQVLLPVWGPRYLRQCLDVCLPSLLAPGNIPAVAAVSPTTLILMTRDRDMPLIRRHPAWLTLAAMCDARLESIDDLLSQAASVVLTLAYARAIRALGATARDIGFVFLVADYVIADGSLRHVVGCLRDGADAVLAGNFQIVQQATDKLFAAARPAGDNVLCIPPRALVRLALEWLHPATRACMAGPTVAFDRRANRVFWRVGPDTLLGRFYLMHMVAIRPQTLDVTIASPCDYSFIPEFCPGGRIETITDSDAYMVVEMQPEAPSQSSRPGVLDAAALAGSLQEWVTARHRSNAACPIVYHASETMPGLAEAIDQSDRLVAETNRLLGLTAHPHRHHPYWSGALDHHQATALHPVDWQALKAILGPGGVPDTVGGPRQRLLGRMPLPRPWHPHWTDLRVVQARTVALATGRSLLIVSAEPGRVRAHLMTSARVAGARKVAHLEPLDVLEAAVQDRPAQAAPASLPRYDAALVIVGPAQLGTLHELSQAVAGVLADDAHVLFVLSDLTDADPHAIRAAEVAAAAKRVDRRLRMTSIQTVPAPRWRIASQTAMMTHARAAMRCRGMTSRLRHLAIGIACAGPGLVANLMGLLGTELGGHRPCSTALLHLVRDRQPAAAHLAQVKAPKVQAMDDTWTI